MERSVYRCGALVLVYATFEIIDRGAVCTLRKHARRRTMPYVHDGITVVAGISGSIDVAYFDLASILKTAAAHASRNRRCGSAYVTARDSIAEGIEDALARKPLRKKTRSCRVLDSFRPNSGFICVRATYIG